MKIIIKRKVSPAPAPVYTEPVKPKTKEDDAEALRQAREYYKEKRLDEKTPENPDDRPIMTLLPDGTIKGNPDGKWEIAAKIPFEGSRG